MDCYEMSLYIYDLFIFYFFILFFGCIVAVFIFIYSFYFLYAKLCIVDQWKFVLFKKKKKKYTFIYLWQTNAP